MSSACECHINPEKCKCCLNNYETNAERLKKAKEWHHDLRQTLVVADLDEKNKNVVRNYADTLKGLIEQAERSSRLVEILRSNKEVTTHRVKRLKSLEDENKRLRKGLEEILKPLNQTPYEKEHTYRTLAREALEGTK
ncbi:hypothetical protein [Sporosarcina jiandibaonis]|uniref:hypothetical protein n=1 Tax=Sporosarcina jiandibaonis TaxID=2715535 RepID=UPI0015570150|nr:hypothetical protein [Sporosarcina jiandibaonis]